MAATAVNLIVSDRPPASRLALLVGVGAASAREAVRWLSSAGFDVASARSMPEAFAAAERTRPDVVLAEASLRDSAGLSACRVLRSHALLRDVPLVALCASRRDAAAAVGAGAADVLDRPYDWGVACVRAGRVVEVARAAAELAQAREEAARLRQALEDERRERTWRDQFDPLTGLPASERFERTLASALATASAGSQVVVALVD